MKVGFSLPALSYRDTLLKELWGSVGTQTPCDNNNNNNNDDFIFIALFHVEHAQLR